MKSKNILLISIAVMLISITTSRICAEDKVDLRLRLEKGQSYKLRTSQELKINQTIPGQQGQQQTMTITEKTGTGEIYTVEDVQADGTLVLKVTYDSLLFKQESPSVGSNVEYVEYDSTNLSAAVGTIAPILGAVVGQNFTTTITPDGRVKEIKGADGILNRIQEKINELPEGTERAGMEAEFKRQYGEGTLKNEMENLVNIYPDNPVGIGDTWQRRTTFARGIPMIIDAIYTLKERKDGVAVIDVFAMIQTNRDAGPRETGRMKRSYNMSGNVTGVMEMQESTGWVIRCNQNFRLSGNVIVENPDRPQPIMSIPMSISGPITVEPY